MQLGLLQLAARDRITPWLHDGEFDDKVIEVAARFPMGWMEIGVVRQGLPFDVEEFFNRLKQS
jgi:hypothetical protein